MLYALDNIVLLLSRAVLSRTKFFTQVMKGYSLVSSQTLNSDAKVNFSRPSIDVFFEL